MKNEKYITLLLKQTDGLLSEHEQVLLDNWIAQSLQNRMLAETVNKAYRQKTSVAPQTDIDLDMEYVLLKNRIDKADSPATSQGRFKIWKIAATFLLLLGSFWVWKIVPSTQDGIVTYRGPKAQMTLSDGSDIWLAEHSTLQYSQSESARWAKIEGKGFFNIAVDKTRPFTVQSKLGSIVVTGTSFEVDATQEHMSVTVLEGSVVVFNQHHTDSSHLEAGNQATIRPNQKIQQQPNQTGSAISSWRSPHISFKDVAFGEVLNTVHQYYAVKFIAEDSTLLNCNITFTLTFPPIEELILSFETILGLEIAQNDAQQYLLSGNGCK